MTKPALINLACSLLHWSSISFLNKPSNSFLYQSDSICACSANKKCPVNFSLHTALYYHGRITLCPVCRVLAADILLFIVYKCPQPPWSFVCTHARVRDGPNCREIFECLQRSSAAYGKKEECSPLTLNIQVLRENICTSKYLK